MENEKPLVSIVVLSYNSSQTILETLESIEAQTYSNIEIVVTDDFSKDNTVQICQKWFESHSSHFVRHQLIVPSSNTGLPANINRGVQASKGEWIKLVAGDDMLLPDAIEKYVIYVNKLETAQLVFAKTFLFYKNSNNQIVEEPCHGVSSESISYFNNQTAREQYLSFLKDIAKCGGGSPSVFVRRKLLIQYPYNENYSGFDDVPEYIKLTRNGIHLNCMDEYTVRYRRGETLTSSKIHFFSPLYWSSKQQFFWNELQYYLKDEGLYDDYNRKRKELLRIELVNLLTKNRVTFINRIKKSLVYRFVKYIDFPRW